MAGTSDPASGSDKAKAAIAEPSATFGRYRSRISSLPASEMAPLPRPCMAKAKSARPSWRASVSRTMHKARESISGQRPPRSEEHTSELQSLMRISYAVFCLKKQTLDTAKDEENTII